MKSKSGNHPLTSSQMKLNLRKRLLHPEPPVNLNVVLNLISDRQQFLTVTELKIFSVQFLPFFYPKDSEPVLLELVFNLTAEGTKLPADLQRGRSCHLKRKHFQQHESILGSELARSVLATLHNKMPQNCFNPLFSPHLNFLKSLVPRLSRCLRLFVNLVYQILEIPFVHL